MNRSTLKTTAVLVVAAVAIFGTLVALGARRAAADLHAETADLQAEIADLRAEVTRQQRSLDELHEGVRTHVAKRRHGGESGW